MDKQADMNSPLHCMFTSLTSCENCIKAKFVLLYYLVRPAECWQNNDW